MSEDPEPLLATDEERAEAAYWANLYGRWDPMGLDAVRELMRGFDRPWWVVGGWAIDGFTGQRRVHADLDLSILACDVSALRQHLRGGWQLWNLWKGDMRPLTDQHPEIFAPDSQLWLRADADGPWVVDIPITPDHAGLWTNKVVPTHRVPLDDATWVAEDGVRYLNPEIVLFFKARLRRAKDERDLERCLPLLTAAQLSWLREALAAHYGDHPWCQILDRATNT